MAENHNKFAEAMMESGVQLATVDMCDVSSSSNINAARWGSIRHKLRKAAAEFIGTAILLTFGFGATTQLVLTDSSSWGTMVAVWGTALTVAIYAVGGVSGAHLNPAVSLTMCVFRGFSYTDLPFYWVAQTCGAFMAALIVYFFNEPAIYAARLEDPSHAIGIFVTSRAAGVTVPVAFFVEFLATAILLFSVLATSEGRGITPTDPRFQPVALGITLTAIGLGLGQQTGFALNPARDLGPRIFVAIAGWGTEAFSRQGYYFWLPIVAPFCGAFAGAFAHDLLANPQDKSSL
ncbi:glycerol channel [Linnemannia hyalina]|uniref:Glycerol channel n=1 Tax=Linnemannia hyalina TaxID=64524 RepID=A0A9P8BU28_9FUNG|nr:glycerol channel [Linnemannia hyalina]